MSHRFYAVSIRCLLVVLIVLPRLFSSVPKTLLKTASAATFPNDTSATDCEDQCYIECDDINGTTPMHYNYTNITVPPPTAEFNVTTPSVNPVVTNETSSLPLTPSPAPEVPLFDSRIDYVIRIRKDPGKYRKPNFTFYNMVKKSDSVKLHIHEAVELSDHLLHDVDKNGIEQVINGTKFVEFKIPTVTFRTNCTAVKRTSFEQVDKVADISGDVKLHNVKIRFIEEPLPHKCEVEFSVVVMDQVSRSRFGDLSQLMKSAFETALCCNEKLKKEPSLPYEPSENPFGNFSDVPPTLKRRSCFKETAENQLAIDPLVDDKWKAAHKVQTKGELFCDYGLDNPIPGSGADSQACLSRNDPIYQNSSLVVAVGDRFFKLLLKKGTLNRLFTYHERDPPFDKPVYWDGQWRAIREYINQTKSDNGTVYEVRYTFLPNWEYSITWNTVEGPPQGRLHLTFDLEISYRSTCFTDNYTQVTVIKGTTHVFSVNFRTEVNVMKENPPRHYLKIYSFGIRPVPGQVLWPYSNDTNESSLARWIVKDLFYDFLRSGTYIPYPRHQNEAITVNGLVQIGGQFCLYANYVPTEIVTNSSFASENITGTTTSERVTVSTPSEPVTKSRANETVSTSAPSKRATNSTRFENVTASTPSKSITNIRTTRNIFDDNVEYYKEP